MPQPHTSTPIPATLAELRAAPPAAHDRLGCADTLREILQQPRTWRATDALIGDAAAGDVLALEPRPAHIVLTGSGSSLYVGECLAPVLQAALGVPCRAMAAGTLLAERDSVLPPGGDGLLVSIARSGNSPESVGVVDAMLAHAPGWRHLVVTCNAEGKLATRYVDEPRVRTLLLDPDTNDRSLVMTSSFTNLVHAVSGLMPGSAGAGIAAADVAATLIDTHGDALARWGARQEMQAVLCLGDGAQYGAAREVALKLLEMSAGAVRVMCETSLGLRHGPMAWLNRPSHLLVFLSGDAGMRAYQVDLLQELTRKRLGPARIVIGESPAPELVGEEGLGIDLPGLYALPAAQQAMVHVVAGQLLALFRCLSLGQKPDAPSEGVLTRVVEAFTLHGGTPA